MIYVAGGFICGHIYFYFSQSCPFSVKTLSEGKTPRFLSGFFLLNAKDGEVIAWNGGETREVMEKQPKYVNSGYPAPWYPLQTRLWLKLKKTIGV